MAFHKLIFVIKHAVATENIAACEWLWCLLYEALAHFQSLCARRVKPGFRQVKYRIMHPYRAWHIIPLAEPLDRCRAKSGPAMLIRSRFLWHGKRRCHEFGSFISGVIKPIIHKIARCYPRILALANFPVG